MGKREELKRIWSECFDDTPDYVNWYFDRVYTEENALSLVKDGETVSGLLLPRYELEFHRQQVPVGYIVGAGTRRKYRGKGYMSELIKEALRQSRNRGDIFTFIIPAEEWLFYYYEQFGFSVVVFNDIQRFTSLHSFSGPEGYRMVENVYADEVYEAFHRMELSREGMILHSKRDFVNIIDDLNLDGGYFVAMKNADGQIVSMTWALERDGYVTIKELLADDEAAGTAAMRQVREAYPDLPFRMMAAPEDSHRRLYSYGMARTVNVEKCMKVLAEQHPKWQAAIKVTDPLIKENNHIYVASHGSVEIVDDYDSTLDLDVNIDVFNRTLFSTPAMGRLMGVPSVRPRMSLMLD